MVWIIFESHATSDDNEAGIASGWRNPNLSKKGIEEAKELGKRRPKLDFNAVFCSDLNRAHQTAVWAYENDPKFIFVDWRLRECDYGDFSHKSGDFITKERASRIKEPFPRGESLDDCMQRMNYFINDLKAKFDGKKVLVIGSRATQYGLEHWLNGKSLEECVAEPWHWQPGWEYELH